MYPTAIVNGPKVFHTIRFYTAAHLNCKVLSGAQSTYSLW